MIRNATTDDFSEIEKMASQFWPDAGFDVPYKEGSAMFYIKLAYNQSLLIVAEKDNELVGFAAGAKSPLMGNSDFTAGSELAWWVHPDHRGGKLGIQLLQGLEQAAKEAGCHYWSMIFMQSSMPDTIKGIYEKMGYKLQETTYLKRIR